MTIQINELKDKGSVFLLIKYNDGEKCNMILKFLGYENEENLNNKKWEFISRLWD